MSSEMVPSGNRYAPGHLAALRRFSIGITVITVLGHTWFGFEQSYAQPLVALITAYSMQILLEVIDARCSGRRPRFAGGFLNLVDFLLSAHITALAVVMMLYYNDRLWVVAFAAAVGIGSKAIFRAPHGTGTRHFFNPSNLGISVTLFVFPAVSLAFPWQFTAAFGNIGDWLLPAIIACIGTFLHGRFTGRLPVIVAFLVGFVLQMVARWLAFDTPILPMIAPVTGVAAMIYTFFMLPDPATTPDSWRAQVVFGAMVAAVYFVLVALQVVFGLFFALTIVCAARGVWLWVVALISIPVKSGALTPAASQA